MEHACGAHRASEMIMLVGCGFSRVSAMTAGTLAAGNAPRGKRKFLRGSGGIKKGFRAILGISGNVSAS